jgi:GNAT superfamily N-acetyltransferase
MATIPMFENDEHGDVTTYRSGLPHPLFNGIVGGRFARGTEEQRSREVLEPFVEAGLPFLWWSTPSTWSEGTDRALLEVGALRDDSPGMHVDLKQLTPSGRPVDGLVLSVAGPGDMVTMSRLLCEGFDFPDGLQGPVRRLFEGFDGDRLVNLLATLDGEPVGCGSLWITGETAGLYNIAVLDDVRHRGVGYALTSALLDHARERGCTESVLHATTLGRPVYERLGYVEVCQLPQYVWVPTA